MRRTSRLGFSVNFLSDAAGAKTSADASVESLYRTIPNGGYVIANVTLVVPLKQLITMA
jgi:hypothetical protein